MVPILFFMWSCIYLYALVKRISGPGIALMSVLSYGLLPLNIIYSRNIMPESALMFFTLGALYHFTRWVQNGSTAHYAASLLLTVLTAMTKLPSVLIGIPMIYLAFKKWGLGSFKKIKLILFPAAVFSLTYAYMAWLGSIAEHRFVSGIGFNMILPNFYSAIFKYENIKYLLVQFAAKIFTLPGIALFAFGLWISYRRADHMYYFWLLSAFLHIVLIDAVIHLDYYLMYITPIVSVFIGAALNRLLSAGKYRLAFWGALMLVAASSTAFLVPAYSLNRDYITYGRDISGVVPYNELIITDTGSPELLYASGRKGWRLHGDLLTGENIENRKALGASYFAPVKPGAHPDIEKILNSKYEKILFPDGYYIYRLK
jgi:4-amino-4-deoxy-L-arabinose transferase-like glycosyltransferase